MPTWFQSKQNSVAINRGWGHCDLTISSGRMFTLWTGVRLLMLRQALDSEPAPWASPLPCTGCHCRGYVFRRRAGKGTEILWPVPYLFICNNPFSALVQTLFYPCTSLLANNKHQNIVFPLTAPYDAQWISLVCDSPTSSSSSLINWSIICRMTPPNSNNICQ